MAAVSSTMNSHRPVNTMEVGCQTSFTSPQNVGEKLEEVNAVLMRDVAKLTAEVVVLGSLVGVDDQKSQLVQENLGLKQQNLALQEQLSSLMKELNDARKSLLERVQPIQEKLVEYEEDLKNKNSVILQLQNEKQVLLEENTKLQQTVISSTEECTLLKSQLDELTQIIQEVQENVYGSDDQ